MKKLFYILLLALPLLAGNLQLKEGFVSAHTEMLMDSTIDPLNNSLAADLSIQGDDISTLKGTVSVEVGLFISDKSDRDEHMDEATEALKFPLANYAITKVTKVDGANAYTLTGTLDFHGQKRELIFNAEVLQTDDSLTINATSGFLMSEYGIEPPCLMFLCVRNPVDLFAKAVLSK